MVTKRYDDICKKHDLDALLLWNSNEIACFTGLQIISGCAVLGEKGKWLILPKGSEATDFSGADARGRQDITVVEYITHGFARRENPFLNLQAEILRAVSGLRRVGISRLRAAWGICPDIPGCELVDVSRDIAQGMATKSAEEIAHFRGVLALNAAAMQAVRDNARAGMSEFEVRAIVENTYHNNAGKLLLSGGDYLSGARIDAVSGGPSRRILQKGDALIVDIQVNWNGMGIDTTRTFFLGAPSEEQARAYEAVRGALCAGEAALLPGKRAGDVYAAVCDSIVRSGYPALAHHAGHGVGWAWYEPPFFIPGEAQLLQKDMLVTLEPGVYPGGFGARLENNYRIGENGAENLFDCPIDLAWATLPE